MNQHISPEIHLVYDTEQILLFVHKRIVSQLFSGYSLEYMLTCNERLHLLHDKVERAKAYEIYQDMDCAVAFKELSCFSEIREMIVSPENLDNTLFRRYSGYAEWYNEHNPQSQITGQFDWVDYYLEIHQKQQNAIEKAIEQFSPPFWILDQIPFDTAFPRFQQLLETLPWEYSGLLENCDNPLYDSMFFEHSQRVVKKRIWFGMSYLLYGLQRSFHITPEHMPTSQSIKHGRAVLMQMLKATDYEESPLCYDIEKYDHYSVEQLTEMLQANAICFDKMLDNA